MNHPHLNEISTMNDGKVTIGVVGPARTGKSLFLRNFTKLLFDGTIDETTLPTSKDGRDICTVQTEFVPKIPEKLQINDNDWLTIQCLECVGYKIHGAKGYRRDRVLIEGNTFSISIKDAITIQVKEAINKLCNYGIVVLTDGSVSDFPRYAYVDAEKQVITDLKSLEKPIIIILNTIEPTSDTILELKEKLEKEYKLPVMPLNVSEIKEQDISEILLMLLNAYPVKEFNVNIPENVMMLEESNPKRVLFTNAVIQIAQKLSTISSLNQVIEEYKALDFIEKVEVNQVNKRSGIVEIELFEKSTFDLEAMK